MTLFLPESGKLYKVHTPFLSTYWPCNFYANTYFYCSEIIPLTDVICFIKEKCVNKTNWYLIIWNNKIGYIPNPVNFIPI